MAALGDKIIPLSSCLLDSSNLSRISRLKPCVELKLILFTNTSFSGVKPAWGLWRFQGGWSASILAWQDTVPFSNSKTQKKNILSKRDQCN